MRWRTARKSRRIEYNKEKIQEYKIQEDKIQEEKAQKEASYGTGTMPLIFILKNSLDCLGNRFSYRS